jgi:hypothetical protein
VQGVPPVDQAAIGRLMAPTSATMAAIQAARVGSSIVPGGDGE